MKHIQVVAAIIIFNKKILCTQRKSNKYDYISLKYEFPGGKIEANETKECALQREIKEELNMDITIEDYFLEVHHNYPDFDIIMHSFICSCVDSTVTLLEHIDYKWLLKDDLLDLDWAAADIPIVEKIMGN
jgi:8-oxo-dGTP diphosphatase